VSDDRIHINERVVFRSLEGSGGVLLNLDSGEYRQLNVMGATIWSMLEAAPSRDQLLAELQERIQDPPPHMGAEVDRFLAALEERKLIRFDGDAPRESPGT
jgi:Coenzyme PQQ synthesis protein D (PqqD)